MPIEAPFAWRAEALAQKFEWAWALGSRWDADGPAAEVIINRTSGGLVEFGGPTVSKPPSETIYDPRLLSRKSLLHATPNT